MKKFVIVIEEIVAQEFVVEADDVEQAMQIAESKYRRGEFVLAPGELVAKQMAVVKPDNEVREWREF